MESREQAVVRLIDEQARLQYDEGDSQRIADATGLLTRDMIGLLDKAGQFHHVATKPIDEDTESEMKYARKELVEYWAFTQVALSKLAAIFRIDGQEAFDKMVEFLGGSEDASLDMTGL